MLTMLKLAVMSFLFIILALLYGNSVTPYSYKKGKMNIVPIYLSGVFGMLAVMEVVGVIILQFEVSVDVLLRVLFAVQLLAVVLVVVLHWSKFGVQFKTAKIPWREYLNGYFIAMVVLVGIETLLLIFFYADQYYPDAYAMGIAARAAQTNELYTENPFTGALTEALDPKLSVSPYIFMMAGLARLTGLHPMTIFHMGVPMIMIPLMYMVYYGIATLYTEDRGKRCLFVIILFLVNILFANYDMNVAAGSFLAIWQGKMIAACVFVPAVWYYTLLLMKKKTMKRWSQLLAVMTGSLFFSPFGAILCPLVLVCIVGYYSVVRRRTDYIAGTGVMLLPAVVTGVIYLIRTLL